MQSPACCAVYGSVGAAGANSIVPLPHHTCTLFAVRSRGSQNGKALFSRVPMFSPIVCAYCNTVLSDGEQDYDSVHCGCPAVDTKWVCQLWVRQRPDPEAGGWRASQAASPVEPLLLEGMLQQGVYLGRCIDADTAEAMQTTQATQAAGAGDCAGAGAGAGAGTGAEEVWMTFEEARSWCHSHSGCEGFTFCHPQRQPTGRVRVRFVRTLRILHSRADHVAAAPSGGGATAGRDSDVDTPWWTYSAGKGC